MASEAVSPDSTKAKPTAILQRLRKEPLIALLVGAALAVTLLMGVVFWSTGPNYGVLYSDLSDRDGGEIIAQLDQMQVPYKITSSGTAIMVPKDAVDKTRLTLAGQGLPKGAGVGYELMDNQSFGISQFAEHINYNRALEGELARSISSIETVSSARVHLAMPQKSVFVRDKKKPTASVVLDLYRGRSLSEGQVSAIRHLVASSVTDLPVDAVTVVDAGGHLLSADKKAGAASMTAGTSTRQLDYEARIEHDYQQRVQDLLIPIFGAGNVRTEVVADVDFSTGEHTQETYTPNDDSGTATIRSEQRSYDGRAGSASGGVPGALSNRPDPNLPSPINNPRSPANAGNGATPSNNAASKTSANDSAQSTGQRGGVHRSSTINYEVNRRIEHVKRDTGRLERLSVAVVINKTEVPAAPAATAADAGDKKTTATTAKSTADAQMAGINRLIRGAVGYSQARGDTVEIIRAPFNTLDADATPPASPPWWKDRSLLNMAQTIFKYLVLAIAVWIAWRRVIRPLLDRGMAGLGPRAPAPAPNAADVAMPAADDGPDAETLLRQRRQAEQRSLRGETEEVARNDPHMAAMIVKGWMNNG